MKEKGYDNITIIDNHSSYEPLLKYYDECGCRVIRMSKNYGHSVFYKCLRFWFARTFKFYCLTDPDLMPVSDCPDDFVELFLRIMRNYPQMPKVGFSLKIDDIPDEYEKKEAVIKWESKWYADEIEAGGGTCQLYYAQLDTTFSLQSPAIFTANLVHSYSAIRTGFPYQLRHLPWYVTSKNEEQQYYLNTSKSGINHW